ncbi:enoyl-CoA hydratase/isomerase family protein [Pseudonocardia sp. ICBG1293]|uniref:enoyl-CoA hydratase/isomerase family protein n=1 Tax=Pseudonocardia sp. ICBG1293 TaxID=2844382 RepID=UPI001CCD82C5|nr:enoyl-CoA hydratase/isomerase family protein [Pseudonocardia sp. ICBG1293]
MITTEHRDGVTVLTIGHGPVNAMDLELCRALTAGLRDVDGPVVVTGSGRAFSAGVDLRRLLDGGTAYVREFLPALDTLFRTVFELEVPFVAAVGGHAIAGGAVLAAAADHVVMAEGRGRFGVPELAVGVAFPQSALEVLRHRVGEPALRRVVLGATTYGPGEARDLGLVDEVTDGSVVLDRAIAVAGGMGTSAPADAFALTARQLRHDGLVRIADTDLDEVLTMWCRRIEDGWTARYLEDTVGRR